MEKVAIVGMGVSLPGAKNLDDFWSNVVQEKQLCRQVDPELWGGQEALSFYCEPKAAKDRVPHAKAYLCERPEFYHSLGEAASLVYPAMLTALSKENTKSGIILGNLALPTRELTRAVFSSLEEHSALELMPSDFIGLGERNSLTPAAQPAEELAEFFGLSKDHSFTLDAACASSLYAVKLACDRLLRSDVEQMYAGGVCKVDSLFLQMGFHQLQALSKSARSRPFDKSADGLLVGEGAAVFRLMRLSKAKEANEKILAVIAGSGISNDVEAGLMAPSSEGQVRAMKEAYEEAGFSPDTIDYLECHATGTRLGDEVELKSWSQMRTQNASACAISSLKSNLGHLLTASGAVGLARTIIAMNKGVLPACSFFETSPESHLAFLSSSNSSISSEARDWPSYSERPRRAAVSAFGFGGTNAHVIVEEYNHQLAESQLDLASSVAIDVIGVGEVEADDSLLEAWPDLELDFADFRIPPNEFEQMLPQQVAMLLAVKRAWQHEPWLTKQARHKLGVVIGLDVDPQSALFRARWSAQAAFKSGLRANHRDNTIEPLNATRVLGSLASIVASRIARELKAGGLGISLSAGELTSQRALETAVDLLQSNKLDTVVVGVVDQLSQLPFKESPYKGDRALCLVLTRAHVGNDPYAKLFAGSKGDAYVMKPQARLRCAAGFAPIFDFLKASKDSKPTLGIKLGDSSYLELKQLKPIQTSLSSNLQSSIRLKNRQALLVRLALNAVKSPLSQEYASVANEEFLESMIQIASQSQRAEFEAQDSFLAYQNLASETIYQLIHNIQTEPDLLGNPNVLATKKQVKQVSSTRDELALFDFEACRTFAEGKLSEVFGADFLEVDSYPSRVRLPMDELLLCHRVMELEGEAKSLSSGSLVTEHDVLDDAWYLDAGRIPSAIAIEAGQADLLLSAWLGADYVTKGKAFYRLLDAQAVFHDSLPGPGKYIRYDIRIERFFKQADNLLFRFNFDASVDGKPLMSMRNGCAGFFTPDALERGRGIVRPAFEAYPKGQGRYTGSYIPRFDFESVRLTDQQLDALRDGDFFEAFGSDFENISSPGFLSLPKGALRLVHRISQMDSRGGWHGLGFALGEADIDPQAWFLTSHFKDDNVMPGTLMYECCLHTLRVFLHRSGWIGEGKDLSISPVDGLAAQLKCRGQVLSTTKKVRYELHIKEMGYRPEAYVVADALMYADDKCIVDILNMNLRIEGLTKEAVDGFWKNHSKDFFSQEQILEFTAGSPVKAFGEAYERFESGLRMARLPRPPYLCLSKVVASDVEAWNMQAGGQALCEFSFETNSWYVRHTTKAPLIAFSVLLEAGLQPCGWMAAYMGSALHSEEELFFRNLQGEAKQLSQVDLSGPALTTKLRCTNISKSGGMIIQSYDFEMMQAGKSIYQAKTSFGFFSESSLAEQKGLSSAHIPALGASIWSDMNGFRQVVRPSPENADLRMLSHFAELDPNGGLFGEGRLLGIYEVRDDDWFFKAHFYQDPVMPGSLGLESVIELIGEAKRQRWPDHEFEARMVEGFEHKWTYRGQLRPSAKRMVCDLHIKHWDEQNSRIHADAYIWVDGLAIYKVENFVVS